MKMLTDLEFGGKAAILPSGHCLSYGQLFLSALKSRYEWRLDYCYGRAHDNTGYLSWESLQSRRVICDHSASALTVAPKLADRSIISRPLHRLELLPATKATLFISSPLWLQFQVGEQVLLELPTLLMSDAWFGPNTREGEIAYASTTRARMEDETGSVDSFKATTALIIVNDGLEKIVLEKINVPVPELALYFKKGAAQKGGPSSRYFTSPIHIHIDSSAQARVSIDQSPAQLQTGAVELSKPRKIRTRSMISRAVDLILA